MTKLSEVIDIINEPNTGIFYLMNAQNPTDLDFTDYAKLDRVYYLAHSYNKYISNYYQLMIDNNLESSIALDILQMFGDKWRREYEALTADYNPINNYDMTEHEEVNSKATVNSSNKRYGFNTPDNSPVGDIDAETTSEGSKDDNYRDLTRSGNIGVTTSAQMIQGELELRKNKFFDIVMNDIDSMLCLKVY